MTLSRIFHLMSAPLRKIGLLQDSLPLDAVKEVIDNNPDFSQLFINHIVQQWHNEDHIWAKYSHKPIPSQYRESLDSLQQFFEELEEEAERKMQVTRETHDIVPHYAVGECLVPIIFKNHRRHSRVPLQR